MRFPPAHDGLSLLFMNLEENQIRVSAPTVRSKYPSAALLPYTRREFAKLALSGAGLLSFMSRLDAAETPAKPNSKVGGVQLGLNVPYSFADPLMSGHDI